MEMRGLDLGAWPGKGEMLRCGACTGGSWRAQEICNPGCVIFSGTGSLQGRMAQELGEKELLRMEVEQLRKEVKNPRTPVSTPASSWSSWSWRRK